MVKVLSLAESMKSNNSEEDNVDFDVALSSSDDGQNAKESSRSSEEFEDASEEAQQDEADCEALGVDLLRFLKKTEFDFYLEKLKEKIDSLEEMVESQERRLKKEISLKAEEYSKGCDIIEKSLAQYMAPI